MDNCIRELEKQMFLRSQAAMLTPTDKSAFGYGEASGIYRGLAIAVEIIQNYTKGIEEEEKNS